MNTKAQELLEAVRNACKPTPDVVPPGWLQLIQIREGAAGNFRVVGDTVRKMVAAGVLELKVFRVQCKGRVVSKTFYSLKQKTR
jgi:hypothetical protein